MVFGSKAKKIKNKAKKFIPHTLSHLFLAKNAKKCEKNHRKIIPKKIEINAWNAI